MGGPAHQVALLSGRRLDPARYETLLVHGSLAPGEASAAGLAAAEGARTVSLPQLTPEISPLADARALVALRALVRRYRPHIVHTHTAKAGFLGRAAALSAGAPRPKLVHTFHGHVLSGYFGPARERLYRGLERGLGRRTDVLVGVSEATVRELVEIDVAPAERFRAIPLGLDLAPLAARAAEPGVGAALRGELGLGADDVVFTFVGRLVPIKRVDRLIDAFALARATVPAARLLIVGDGPERRALEARASAAGLAADVIFAGYRADLARIFAASDCAVISSDNEGTPVSLIEAGACGVPGVSVDVGGVREVLGADAGIVVADHRTSTPVAHAGQEWTFDAEGHGASGASVADDHRTSTSVAHAGQEWTFDAKGHGASEAGASEAGESEAGASGAGVADDHRTSTSVAHAGQEWTFDAKGHDATGYGATGFDATGYDPSARGDFGACALGEAMASLATDPERRAALGRAAAQRMPSRYGAERLLADIDALYSELLATTTR